MKRHHLRCVFFSSFFSQMVGAKRAQTPSTKVLSTRFGIVPDAGSIHSCWRIRRTRTKHSGFDWTKKGRRELHFLGLRAARISRPYQASTFACHVYFGWQVLPDACLEEIRQIGPLLLTHIASRFGAVLRRCNVALCDGLGGVDAMGEKVRVPLRAVEPQPYVCTTITPFVLLLKMNSVYFTGPYYSQGFEGLVEATPDLITWVLLACGGVKKKMII